MKQVTGVIISRRLVPIRRCTLPTNISWQSAVWLALLFPNCLSGIHLGGKRSRRRRKKGDKQERLFLKLANSSARRDWPGYEPRSKCYVFVGANFPTSIAKHRPMTPADDNNDPIFVTRVSTFNILNTVKKNQEKFRIFSIFSNSELKNN